MCAMHKRLLQKMCAKCGANSAHDKLVCSWYSIMCAIEQIFICANSDRTNNLLKVHKQFGDIFHYLFKQSLCSEQILFAQLKKKYASSNVNQIFTIYCKSTLVNFFKINISNKNGISSQNEAM